MPRLLRTPNHHFNNLADFQYSPQYVNINGMRIHYIDEGQGNPVLCLHGNLTWSFIYRKLMAKLLPEYRVIAPDLVGFGRSDKYGEMGYYTYEMHLNTLLSFIEYMNVQGATLVVQGWGGMLGLRALVDFEEYFERIVIMNTYLPLGNRSLSDAVVQWRKLAKHTPDFSVGNIINHGMFTSLAPNVIAAYDAPFPSNEYKNGARAFPLMLPENTANPMVAHMKIARNRLREWNKPLLLMYSELGQSRIVGNAQLWYQHNMPKATIVNREIKNARHFLCEDQGTEIATHISDFLTQIS